MSETPRPIRMSEKLIRDCNKDIGVLFRRAFGNIRLVKPRRTKRLLRQPLPSGDTK